MISSLGRLRACPRKGPCAPANIHPAARGSATSPLSLSWLLADEVRPVRSGDLRHEPVGLEVVDGLGEVGDNRAGVEAPDGGGGIGERAVEEVAVVAQLVLGEVLEP